MNDMLTWVNAGHHDDAIACLSEKVRAAIASSKNSYHLTQHHFDGVNHWSDFVELECVLSHIKWQQEMLEEASDEIAYFREECIRLESENAELWAKQNEFNER